MKIPENSQGYYPGDRVQDKSNRIWTIKGRHHFSSPISYEVKEDADYILNQIDIVRKL